MVQCGLWVLVGSEVLNRESLRHWWHKITEAWLQTGVSPFGILISLRQKRGCKSSPTKIQIMPVDTRAELQGQLNSCFITPLSIEFGGGPITFYPEMTSWIGPNSLWPSVSTGSGSVSRVGTCKIDASERSLICWCQMQSKDVQDGCNGLLACKLQSVVLFVVMLQMTQDVSLLSAFFRFFPQAHFAVLLELGVKFFG